MKLIGILLIISGAVLGLYFGVWVCFVGGIVQVITEGSKLFQTAQPLQIPANPMYIAFGIIRIVSAALVGWVTFLICAFVGSFFLEY